MSDDNLKRYHPLLGIDDKAAFKGERRNDKESNINAFSDVLRQRDDAYYSEMPMNTFDTDPSNMNDDQARLDALRAELQDRVSQVRQNLQTAQKEVPAPAPLNKTRAECPAPPPPKKGLWYDLKNWDKLPVEPGWPRFQYVLNRNKRLGYLASIIIGVMILGYMYQILKTKKEMTTH